MCNVTIVRQVRFFVCFALFLKMKDIDLLNMIHLEVPNTSDNAVLKIRDAVYNGDLKYM